MCGLGRKWTVQLNKSGRSKASKADGPRKWTVQKAKVDVQQKIKLDGPKKCVRFQKGRKVEGPQKYKGNWKG